MTMDSTHARPLITVIVATRNSENTLRACLDSLQRNLADIAQPDEVEVLFIDGYSTDGTVDLIRSYGIGKLFRYPPKGVSNAFNRGVENAQGYFITFLHSDDEYSSGYLKRLLQHARRYKGQDVVIYTSVTFIDESGRELYTRRPAPYIGFIQRYQAIIFHPNALYPAHLMQKFPFEEFPMSDRQQVYQLMRHARGVRDASVSYRFRISEHSETVRLGRSNTDSSPTPLLAKLIKLVGRVYIQAYETRLMPRLWTFIVKGITPWRSGQ